MSGGADPHDRAAVEIDGTLGEGGGQVVRSALTLSLLTGRPVHITGVRLRRRRPGLRAQHLAAVRAAAAVGDAQVEAAVLGSRSLGFAPRRLRTGRFEIEVGTAGATSLVLQTVLVPLVRAAAPSTLALGGGTHVPWSPCFEYVDRAWLPHLREIGVEASVVLERAGFHPRGGGRLRAEIRPAARLAPLIRTERGALERIRGFSAVARLPDSIAERQRQRALERLTVRGVPATLELTRLDAASPGSVLFLDAEFERTRACFFALGARGKRAERVADEAVDDLEAFLGRPGAVDRHLADQLLLPAVLAEGTSELTTTHVTGHLRTNAAVIEAFLGPCIRIDGALDQAGRVRIQGIGEAPGLTGPGAE